MARRRRDNDAASRLDRLFAEKLGHSVGTEILRERLARAKLRLSNGDEPIASVARATGFCNSGYLAAVFKRAFGITPRAFRRGRGA